MHYKEEAEVSASVSNASQGILHCSCSRKPRQQCQNTASHHSFSKKAPNFTAYTGFSHIGCICIYPIKHPHSQSPQFLVSPNLPAFGVSLLSFLPQCYPAGRIPFHILAVPLICWHHASSTAGKAANWIADKFGQQHSFLINITPVQIWSIVLLVGESVVLQSVTTSALKTKWNR